MKRKRPFTSAERLALWQGWKSGLTLVDIARGLDRRPSAIFNVVRREGGYAPKPRKRSDRVLQSSEREEISRGLAAQLPMHELARRLGRSPSTISREIRRNGGREVYRAAEADAQAWRRARRPQRCVLARRPRLRRWVARKLQQDWSPRQIGVGLRRAFPGHEQMRVSHETIYRSLFVQARGVLKQELVGHLRRGGFMRRSRKAPIAPRGSIVDGVSIRERPADAEDRAVPGHWEGDLLMGGNSSQIITLVERSSRYVMLIKTESKDTVTVTKALAAKVRRLPAQLRRSLTWDRGTEMSGHKEFSVATDVQVYFCDPRSPWQRGSNENTNGLLRQYFPRGEDVAIFSQADLNRIALRLNERPRETLNWKTPLEVLKATVASTV
ncbi:MAG TPA: IS30 family transposase [Casimicrobiaceae bacterium]|nr:IS30 family transposase [Casimicrobiaceae bacterium]